MAVDFSSGPGVAALRDKVRRYVREVVVPEEAAAFGDGAESGEDLRRRLQASARERGVFAPTVPVAWGGLGLDMRGLAIVLEEAGHSVLGPLGMNAAAPDEGNMHLLHLVADPAQQERYLRPLANGDIRSCFAMTEPAPGAGSDPSALQTTAQPVAGGWRIDGLKWFITGADGAALTICVARTADDRSAAATLFLIDADNPGMRVVRHIRTLDDGFMGGHCEVVFDGCVVPGEAVLGTVGAGLTHAQVRLAPARLTHCMRWLGLAQRAHELAIGRAAQRSAFGSRLSELGMVQAMIADSEIDLAAGRGLVLRAAWVLDQGERGQHETSIAKAFVAEAVGRVVDRAVQVHGALGVSTDAPLAHMYREVRPFRIYDGPSEVHRWSIARRLVRRRDTPV